MSYLNTPPKKLRHSEQNYALEAAMEIEIRVARVEVEVDTLKDTCQTLQVTVERGFAEQRTAMDQLRNAMERGFAEERAARERAISELRKDMRWMFGLLLTNTFFIVGILLKLGGLA